MTKVWEWIAIDTSRDAQIKDREEISDAMRIRKDKPLFGKYRSGNHFCALGLMLQIFMESHEGDYKWGDGEPFHSSDSLSIPYGRIGGIELTEWTGISPLDLKELAEFSDSDSWRTWREVADRIVSLPIMKNKEWSKNND